MTLYQSPSSALCPDCGQEIDLGPLPEEGEKITCPNCWAYLTITSLEPLELHWVEEVTEEE